MMDIILEFEWIYLIDTKSVYSISLWKWETMGEKSYKCTQSLTQPKTENMLRSLFHNIHSSSESSIMSPKNVYDCTITTLVWHLCISIYFSSNNKNNKRWRHVYFACSMMVRNYGKMRRHWTLHAFSIKTILLNLQNIFQLSNWHAWKRFWAFHRIMLMYRAK